MSNNKRNAFVLISEYLRLPQNARNPLDFTRDELREYIARIFNDPSLLEIKDQNIYPLNTSNMLRFKDQKFKWNDFPVLQLRDIILDDTTSTDWLFNIDWKKTDIYFNVPTHPYDMVYINLKKFFELLNVVPKEITFAFHGSNGAIKTKIISWQTILELAKKGQAVYDFNHLYSFNFKAIASKAMKYCINNSKNSENKDQYLQEINNRTYDIPFLQFMYLVRTIELKPFFKYGHSALNAGIVANELIWSLFGERQFTHYTKEYVEPENSEKRIIFWKGTGKYPPLLGTHYDASKLNTRQSGHDLYSLGFLKADADIGFWLSDSALEFLDIIGNSLKDIDAPCRFNWNTLTEDNRQQAFDWMDRHFKKMKRQISKHNFDT